MRALLVVNPSVGHRTAGPDDLERAVRVIRDAGFIVDRAQTAPDHPDSGDLARRAIAERYDACIPTLGLLDMRMPFMDGWAVARSMRESGSKVPIIVMTAAESAERWADEIGAAGHLAKPFGLDELIACVEEHMGRDRPN